MPTQLIRKHLEEFARWLRNLPEYDDFEYGTEPIRGDKTWIKKGCKKNCESCECKIVNKDES